MTKFQVIIADLPYNFLDKLTQSKVKRGAAANYSTMTNQQLFALPIKDIADPKGALLALWVPSSLLPLGLKLMETYGFKLKQTYIWVKTKKDTKNIDNCLGFGMGRLFRNTHEIALIGINNNGIYKKLKNKSQRTVSLAPNLKHSQKPEHLQDSLDLMFEGEEIKKIELFARRERKGWITVGNDCKSTPGEDIFISLQNLITKK